jgi:hypothetical protein
MIDGMKQSGMVETPALSPIVYTNTGTMQERSAF